MSMAWRENPKTVDIPTLEQVINEKERLKKQDKTYSLECTVAAMAETIKQLRENEDKLRAENERLKDELCNQKIIIAKSGSIAEATVGISGIFQKAQKTADSYIENIKFREGETKKRCEKMIRIARAESRRIREEAKRDIDRQWAEFNKKTEEVLKSYEELESFLDIKE